MTYRLGIDAGSKTIKLVLLDHEGKTVFSQYRLHKSDIRSTMLELLHDGIWRLGDVEAVVTVTGSAGMRIADILDLPFVQEVIATKYAIGQLYPQADVAIELGGEDAKIIYLTDGVEQRMNGSCAGGTGGFIDLMCGTLGVRAQELNSLALGFSTIYPIASRCAVFAQTDVRPLLNEGAKKSDIAASILQAVVTQTVAGLSCGRPIKGTVVFLGGPLQVYSELVSRFRKTLGLTHAQTIKPPDAHLFVAMGAALLSNTLSQETIALSELEQRLKVAPEQEDGGSERLEPLFSTDAELQAFKQRHDRNRVNRSQLMNYSGDVFLGIDAGSTTCKLVLVGSEGELLYSDYEKSRGSVISTLSEMLEGLYRSLPREYDGSLLVTIRHTKVTGYGEQLLKVAFTADSGEVETIAHLRAARELNPKVDFVLDIGGQDIKCLRIRDGVIDDVILNEACSSGCGALIEGFSRSLGYTQWSFSDVALQAKQPVDLGTRCTVFMTSRVRHAQKQGIPAADIAAGLAYSVVRNALYKVIGYTSAEQLGKHMVVQGGTFMSDAVLRAFELECGCEVTRPSIANLMGAYGAALLARDEVLAAKRSGSAPAQSTLLGPCELAGLNQQHGTRRCMGCANNCLLTISSFSNLKGDDPAARVFVTGNRCERGGFAQEIQHKPENLFAYQQQLLAAYDDDYELEPTLAFDKPVIGIPRVLELHASYPFWQTFFKQLGFVVRSIAASNTTLYRSGAQAVMSEAVC
ncbi:MAG: CoA activase, partial [Coriobacteriaceae bacterium]|nr:CoA activase [Coriobacteriaceae bacterium]